MRFLPLLLSVALWTPLALSQTTGVPGVNDYTINGVGSGSTSCTKISGAGAGALTFKVTAAPNSMVILLFSPCPCAPNSMGFGNSCAPLQTLDLSPFCPLYTLPGMTDGTGTMTFVVPPLPCTPPGSFVFSTQAVVLDWTCVSWPFRLTQAYDVCC